MSNQKNESAIPAPAQLVLDFFDNELADVKFPDLDQSVLQQAAERVWALAEEQARAEAALQAAREALQEGQDQLLGKCQRALSYARIYAEDDSDLSRRLEAVTIVRGRSKVPVTTAPADAAEGKVAGKRGRKHTVVPAGNGALFLDSSQAEQVAHSNGANGTA